MLFSVDNEKPLKDRASRKPDTNKLNSVFLNQMITVTRIHHGNKYFHVVKKIAEIVLTTNGIFCVLKKKKSHESVAKNGLSVAPIRKESLFFPPGIWNDLVILHEPLECGGNNFM